MAVTKSTRRKRREGRSQSVCRISGSNRSREAEIEKATAVLIALVYSLSQGLDSEQAGDVAGVALDLIEQAVNALDVVELMKGERASG